MTLRGEQPAGWGPIPRPPAPAGHGLGASCRNWAVCTLRTSITALLAPEADLHCNLTPMRAISQRDYWVFIGQLERGAIASRRIALPGQLALQALTGFPVDQAEDELILDRGDVGLRNGGALLALGFPWGDGGSCGGQYQRYRSTICMA